MSGFWEILANGHGYAYKTDVRRLQQTVRDLRRTSRFRQREVDAAQDERIEALEREVDELRMDLAAAMSLLVSKGVVEPEECRVVGEVVSGPLEADDDAAD